jgi:hypothetical protein
MPASRTEDAGYLQRSGGCVSGRHQDSHPLALGHSRHHRFKTPDASRLLPLKVDEESDYSASRREQGLVMMCFEVGTAIDPAGHDQDPDPASDTNA